MAHLFRYSPCPLHSSSLPSSFLSLSPFLLSLPLPRPVVLDFVIQATAKCLRPFGYVDPSFTPLLHPSQKQNPDQRDTMAPDDVDAATLQAILEIQFEDLERLRRRSKGKGREGAARADFEVALDLLRAEMATSAAVLKDNAICRSMAVAIWRDRAALDNAEHEERVARRDRELALRLSEQDDETMDDEEPMDFDLDSNENPSGIQDDEFLDTLAIKYMMPPGNADNDDASTSGQPESSTWAQSRKQSTQPTPIETAECISCGEDHPVTDVVGCLCSHNYCRQCLARLFQASMVDESLFPPRCCSQPIPLEESRNHLSAELVGQFMAKKLEFETPNRTYCHVPGCSAFVPPQFVRADIAACVKCNNKTCAICKGATHAGECPQDEEAQAVLRLADENGWQRCSDCRRVVELQQGCNHISMALSLISGLLSPDPGIFTDPPRPQHAYAAQNSATSAPRNGRPVTAMCGTRPCSMCGRRRSSAVRDTTIWTTASGSSWCKKRCGTNRRITSARPTNGPSSLAHTTATGAAATCLPISLSAWAAGSWRAGAVG